MIDEPPPSAGALASPRTWRGWARAHAGLLLFAALFVGAHVWYLSRPLPSNLPIVGDGVGDPALDAHFFALIAIVEAYPISRPYPAAREASGSVQYRQSLERGKQRWEIVSPATKSWTQVVLTPSDGSEPLRLTWIQDADPGSGSAHVGGWTTDGRYYALYGRGQFADTWGPQDSFVVLVDPRRRVAYRRLVR